MNSLPKIVTAAALLITFAGLGCHARRPPQNVAVTDGVAKISALHRTEGELNDRYAIDLKTRTTDERALGARRQEVRVLLQRYLREADDVLAIGLVDKKVVLTDRDVIVARREAARNVLESLAIGGEASEDRPLDI